MESEKSKRAVVMIKRTLIEWCEDTTSHGFLNIVKAGNIFIRLLWTVCLLASSAFCAYLIYTAVDSYLSNPTTTTISVVGDVPAYFPTVSICSLNPLSTDNATLNAEIANMISQINLYKYDKPISLSQISISRQISYYLSRLNGSDRQRYGNTIEESLYFCKFNSKPCLRDFLEWYWDFNLGNCYKFNAKGDLKVGKSGFVPSLQLQFVIGNSQTKNDFYQDTGMKILIHNHTLAAPQVYENGLSLSPGFNYDIKVSRTYYDRLGPPFSDCLEDLTNSSSKQTELMKVMFQALNLTTYNQEYCQNLAFQGTLASLCKCVNPAYPYWDTTLPKCINRTQVICQDDKFQLVYANPDLYFGEQCPEECDYYEYATKITQSAFPTEWFFNNSNLYDVTSSKIRDRISKINSYSEADKYFISFNIYYNEMSYHYIKEDPYWDVFLLFSNIGGNLGLFVGMSFLSFVEIFELIFKLIEILVAGSFKVKKSTPVVPFRDDKI